MTDSQNEPIASHYTPLLSEDDMDSSYLKNVRFRNRNNTEGARGAQSAQLAKSDEDSQRSDSQMQAEIYNENMRSQNFDKTPKGMLDN